MADNSTRKDAAGATESLASDDIAGVKHQRVKIEVGADGAANDVQPPTDSQAQASMLPAAAMVWDDVLAAGVRVRTPRTDAFAHTALLADAPYLFNGATHDRQRGNIEGTLLASAARTSTTLSAVQTNHNARGILVMLNVTVASGTGGLQVRVLGRDPVSGGSYGVVALPTAITATGLYVYDYYPGAGGSNSVSIARVSAPIPRQFFVQVTHGDGSSYTYSVGFSLIV